MGSAEELAERMRRLGFVADIVEQDGGCQWLMVRKIRTTPGNRLSGGEALRFEEHDGREVVFEVDSPKAHVMISGATFAFSVAAGIPSSPGAYSKTFTDADAVYEEILHYYFDLDSRMSMEEGFEPGPGRPAGA